MSLFDQLGGALAGVGGQGQLMQAVGMLLEQSGGVEGLLEKFRAGGLGDVISSWLGSGENLPISASQIEAVIGQGALAELSGKLGLDSADLAQQLAGQLPDLVSQLSADGKLDAGNLLSKGAGLLGGLLGR